MKHALDRDWLALSRESTFSWSDGGRSPHGRQLMAIAYASARTLASGCRRSLIISSRHGVFRPKPAPCRTSSTADSPPARSPRAVSRVMVVVRTLPYLTRRSAIGAV